LKTLDQGGTVVTGSLTTGSVAYQDSGSNLFNRYESFSLSFLNAHSQDVFTGALTPPPTSPSCLLGSTSTYLYAGIAAPGRPFLPAFQDAGPSVTISGPIPDKLAIAKSNNSYSKTFDPSPSAPSLAALAPPFFPGGSYTLAAAGGSDIPAFELPFTLPTPLNWTNRDQVGTIDRNADLVLSWDNQDYAESDAVSLILISPGVPDATSAQAIVCNAPALPGKLLIARDLLQKVAPANPTAISTLSMSVTPDSSRPRLISVPLKAGGTAPVTVSRYSSEIMPVVIR
jgi:hypothetical protein